MDTARRSTSWALAILLVAAALHAPLLRLALCGEEGNFASAVRDVSRFHKPRLLIARNLEGKEFTTLPGHNLGGYAVPAVLAGPIRALAGFRTDGERARYAILLRSCFLVLWSLALVLACLAIAPSHRPVAALLLLAFSLFVVPLLGSIQIQYDGAVSTLLVTTLVVLLSVRSDRAWAWALAGLVISVGKLEFAALGTGVALVTAISHRSWRGLAAFVAALLVGFAICYAIDAENFVGGYGVPQRFWGMQAATPLSVRVPSYLRAMWPMIWPAFAGVAIGAIGFLLSPERKRAVPALAGAAGICVGYSIMSWTGDGFPRYFAPCFVLVPLALARLSPPRWVLAVIAATTILFAAPGYLGELRAGPLLMCARLGGSDARPTLRRTPRMPPTCVPAVSSESAPGFYSATAPFACCWAQWANWPDLTPELCP